MKKKTNRGLKIICLNRKASFNYFFQDLIEAGIVLNSALEEGLVYAEEEMIIDVEKFRNNLSQAYQEAISLSIEAAYITKDNIKQILAKAAQSATSVSVETGYITDETKEQILQKADAHAKGVASKAKDYTPT